MSNKFCPNCGFKLEEGFNICPNCGFKLSKIESEKKDDFDDIFNDDLSESEKIEQGFDNLLNKQLSKQKEHNDTLSKALDFINNGNYLEAETIYKNLINKNVDDIQAQIGLIRVASKNFTTFYYDFDKDLEALSILFSIKELTDKDKDFSKYYKKYETRKSKLSTLKIPLHAIVNFGTYITKKGDKHPIEWEVIDNNKEYLTLRPLYILGQIYLQNDSIDVVTDYLNNNFVKNSFSNDEKENIQAINGAYATLFNEDELFSILHEDNCFLQNANVNIAAPRMADYILCYGIDENNQKGNSKYLLSYDFNGNRDRYVVNEKQYAIYPKIVVKQSYIAKIYDDSQKINYTPHTIVEGDYIQFGSTDNHKIIWQVLKVEKLQLVLIASDYICGAYTSDEDFNSQKKKIDQKLKEIYTSNFTKDEQKRILLNPTNGLLLNLPSNKLLENNIFKQIVTKQKKVWLDYPISQNGKRYLAYADISNDKVSDNPSCNTTGIISIAPIIYIKSKEKDSRYTKEELKEIKDSQTVIIESLKQKELEQIQKEKERIQKEYEEKQRKIEEKKQTELELFIQKYKMFICTKENDEIAILGLHKDYANLRNLNLIIPDDCSIIRKNAFKNCKNINSITNNSEELTIEDSAFESSSISEFIDNGKIQIIGKCAFKNCKNLKELSFNHGIKMIDDYAFMDSSISDLNLKTGISTFYGKFIIQGTNIEKLTLPYTISSIEYGAFYSEKLKVISISNNEKCKKFKTFKGILYHNLECSGYELLTYPAARPTDHFSIQSLPDEENGAVYAVAPLAFYKANNLIQFSGRIAFKWIHKEAFKECKNLKKVDNIYDIELIESKAFENCEDLKATGLDNMKSYRKGEKITIESNAYLGCNRIKRFYIFKNSVIAPDAFPNPKIYKKKNFPFSCPYFLTPIVSVIYGIIDFFKEVF